MTSTTYPDSLQGLFRVPGVQIQVVPRDHTVLATELGLAIMTQNDAENRRQERMWSEIGEDPIIPR